MESLNTTSESIGLVIIKFSVVPYLLRTILLLAEKLTPPYFLNDIILYIYFEYFLSIRMYCIVMYNEMKSSLYISL